MTPNSSWICNDDENGEDRKTGESGGGGWVGGAPRDTVPPNQCNCAFGASVQVFSVQVCNWQCLNVVQCNQEYCDTNR